MLGHPGDAVGDWNSGDISNGTFLQLHEITALCAVNSNFRRCYRRMLAEELKRKFINKLESHGHSLNDKDCRVADLLRMLAHPLQQHSRTNSIVTNGAE